MKKIILLCTFVAPYAFHTYASHEKELPTSSSSSKKKRSQQADTFQRITIKVDKKAELGEGCVGTSLVTHSSENYVATIIDPWFNELFKKVNEWQLPMQDTRIINGHLSLIITSLNALKDMSEEFSTEKKSDASKVETPQEKDATKKPKKNNKRKK